jgi:hypothetical protein
MSIMTGRSALSRTPNGHWTTSASRSRAWHCAASAAMQPGWGFSGAGSVSRPSGRRCRARDRLRGARPGASRACAPAMGAVGRPATRGAPRSSRPPPAPRSWPANAAARRSRGNRDCRLADEENGKQETEDRKQETGHRVGFAMPFRGVVRLTLAVCFDFPRILHKASTSVRRSSNAGLGVKLAPATTRSQYRVSWISFSAIPSLWRKSRRLSAARASS